MSLLLLMPCPLSGPFIFRDLVCYYQLVDHSLVLCVGLILSCWSFRPSPWCLIGWLSYCVRWLPSIWITTLQKLISVISVVQCHPFFWLAFQVLSLTNKYSITLIPAYILTQLNMEASYLSQGWLLLEWHLVPQMGQAAFCLLAFTRDESAAIFLYHSVPEL